MNLHIEHTTPLARRSLNRPAPIAPGEVKLEGRYVIDPNPSGAAELDWRSWIDQVRLACQGEILTTEGEILWIADLRAVPHAAIHLYGHLFTDEEHRAAGRKRPALRHGFLARRLLRRTILAAHTGCDPDDIRISSTCVHCGDRGHGKPVLEARPDVHFNAASSMHTMVLAISGAPVGVDVERSQRVNESMLRHVAATAHRTWPALAGRPGTRHAPLRTWTATEALAKGLGLGLAATDEDLARALPAWTLAWFEPEPGLTVCWAAPAGQPAVVVRRCPVEFRPATSIDVRHAPSATI